MIDEDRLRARLLRSCSDGGYWAQLYRNDVEELLEERRALLALLSGDDTERPPAPEKPFPPIGPSVCDGCGRELP